MNWQGPNSVVRSFRRRVVYSNERSCVNCTNEHGCWGDGHVNPVYPSGFRLRESWHPEDIEPYIKTVFGGVCGHFIHNNPAVNESMARTEAEKIAKENIWDK